jgi:hypothetical protein
MLLMETEASQDRRVVEILTAKDEVAEYPL